MICGELPHVDRPCDPIKWKYRQLFLCMITLWGVSRAAATVTESCYLRKVHRPSYCPGGPASVSYCYCTNRSVHSVHSVHTVHSVHSVHTVQPTNMDVEFAGRFTLLQNPSCQEKCFHFGKLQLLES